MYKQKLLVTNTLLFLFIANFILFTDIAFSVNNEYHNDKPVIIIDPGHGGYDNGVMGNYGLSEKKVSLIFSNILHDKLKGKYKIILTRTDDYFVSLVDRTSFANHMAGNLLISIHTGGGKNYRFSSLTLYYGINNKQHVQLDIDAPLPYISYTNPDDIWDLVYNRYIDDSKKITRLIKKKYTDSENKECKIRQHPLFLLKGADMPAILIEIGNLSNPVCEDKELSNKKYLIRLSEILVSAIDEYFK